MSALHSPPSTRLGGLNQLTMELLLGEETGDMVDGTADASREGGEDGDRADGDHSKDHTVLGHRLALLLAPVGAQELEPLRERHFDSPPFDSLVHAHGALKTETSFERKYRSTVRMKRAVAVVTLWKTSKSLSGVAAPPELARSAPCIDLAETTAYPSDKGLPATSPQMGEGRRRRLPRYLLPVRAARIVVTRADAMASALDEREPRHVFQAPPSHGAVPLPPTLRLVRGMGARRARPRAGRRLRVPALASACVGRPRRGGRRPADRVGSQGRRRKP